MRTAPFAGCAPMYLRQFERSLPPPNSAPTIVVARPRIVPQPLPMLPSQPSNFVSTLRRPLPHEVAQHFQDYNLRRCHN